MEDLDAILQPGLHDHGSYRSTTDDVADAAIWEHLAGMDPVHAAISVTDEDDEREKTRGLLQTLLAEAVDGVILDVGCGYGRVAKYLLPQRRFPGYVGLDGSETMLELFDARYRSRPQEQTTQLVLIRSPVDRLPLVDGSIGNVVVAGVLLHNTKSVNTRLVAEAYRVLAPGGKLFVLGRDLINARTLGGLQSTLYLRLLRSRGEGERNGPSHPYSLGEVRTLLGAFSNVRIRGMEFRVLPKRLIALPDAVTPTYRRLVYEPVQFVADLATPQPLKRRVPDHWHVIATK